MPRLIYLEAMTGYDARENARRLEILRSYLSPGFTIDTLRPADGPKVLEQPEDFAQMQRAALGAVTGVAPDACGAIIAGGAVDPGLDALRAAARVPVVGPGEASLYLARLLGSRLAILTVEPAVPGAYAMIQHVAAKPDVVVVRPMKTTVRKILADPDEGRRVMREAAAAAIREDKADVLYLGSMTQGTLGITQDLRAQFGVPVLDPLPVSIRTAEQAAAARG
ncbi:MAG TPA: aspartate/glutamate racemase family protein [bacterium]|nr:aspartate/glutamate racemase family protein [bacterium]